MRLESTIQSILFGQLLMIIGCYRVILVNGSDNIDMDAGDANRGGTPIITSVGYAFETFTPYSMIRFFEFSDKEWNISENCFADMYEYIEGLKQNEYWAIKLYDASGYYSGSLFSGSNKRVHNPNLCRFLSRQFNEFKHKLLELPFVISFDVQLVTAHYLMELPFDDYYKFEKIQQLICFPKSCRNWDLREILEVFPGGQSRIYVKNNTYLRHRIVPDNYRILDDFNFYIMITIILGAILIHLTILLVKSHLNTVNTSNGGIYITKANIFDSLRLSTYGRTFNSNDSPMYANAIQLAENLPKIVDKTDKYCFENLLEAVSLPSVVYNLIQEDPVTPVSGIMVLFTMAFVAVHLIAEIMYTATNMDFGLMGNKIEWTNLLLKRSAFIMDIYFLINGCYLAYGFLKNFPKIELSVYEQLKYIWKIILQKLFGLTPCYLFVIYYAQIMDKHFYHNNVLEIPTRDYRNCPQKLLANLFYIDTFFPLNERCMPWTWFISLEIQYFLMGLLIMLLVKVNFWYAIIISVSVFFIAWLASTFWLMAPFVQYGYSTSLHYELLSFNLVLENVCLFAMPFIMGLCLGCIIFKTNHNLNLNACLLTSGWLLGLLIIVLSIFGYDLIVNKLNVLQKALFDITAHILWCSLLVWIILTCTTSYGDSLNNLLNFKYSHTLEQLTPISVLLIPIIIRLVLFSADSPVQWSLGQMIPLIIGCLLISYLGSSILYVLMLGPVKAAMDIFIVNTG